MRLQEEGLNEQVKDEAEAEAQVEEIQEPEEETKEAPVEEIKEVPVEESKEEPVQEKPVEDIKGNEDEVIQKETPIQKYLVKFNVYTSVVNEQERDIRIRISATLKQIMNVYSNMRRYRNAKKYQDLCEKIFEDVWGEERPYVEYTGFLNCVGDLYLKKGGKDSYDIALKAY